jgi:hypothetical protein
MSRTSAKFLEICLAEVLNSGETMTYQFGVSSFSSVIDSLLYMKLYSVAIEVFKALGLET